MDQIGIVFSIVLFAASVIVAYFFGFEPRKRKADVDKLKDSVKKKNVELISLYNDVQALVQIESYLIQELGISKQKSREGYTISNRCEPKRIEKRIVELEEQISKL